MDITTFLRNRGFTEFERQSQQVTDLIKLTSKPNIRVMEIGFNAGYLAEVFLKSNNTLRLTSFDSGVRDYVTHAKEFIDLYYPTRHQLILGDSKDTVPQFSRDNPNVKFDFIFIYRDNYVTARQDVANCRAFAHSETIVALDDTLYKAQVVLDYNRGPRVTEPAKQGTVSKFAIQRKEYSGGRGMSWGKYMV